MTLIRLALATAVVLAPGAAVARALGLRGAAATLAWAFGALFAALGVTILVEGSLTLTLVLLLGIGVAALLIGYQAPRPERIPGRGWVFLAGVVLGIALWHVAGEIGGDGFFHLARVRKLEAFDSLSLGAVNEFADGGLHPGYAFPLWHAFLALVARVAFVDPSEVVLHEASVLAPLALVVAYEAGWALFRRVGPAVAVVCAAVGITALAPAGGGAYTALGLPATASRQLLVPAALALALTACVPGTQGRFGSLAALASAAAAGLALAVVHPTYAIFLWLPFVGFLVVRTLVARHEAKRIAAALAALVVPAAAYLAWLTPVVRATASHAPGRDELARAFARYQGQLDVFSDERYRLAPEVFGRSGAVAVAALLSIPLAGLALRRRWAAYVLGGSLAVLAVTLVPLLFVPFSDLVSLSQSRRAAGFLPYAFAFAGGLVVLARLTRWAVLPLALAAGIVLQLAYPGDFGYRLQDGGPALATWIAVVGGAAALALGLWRRPALENRGGIVGIAAVLFVVPSPYTRPGTGARPTRGRRIPLTPGLTEALRELPDGDVVFSDLETSYRIAAAAPVYVAAAPPSHVADTTKNRPYERRLDTIDVLRRRRPRDPAALRRRLARRRPRPLRPPRGASRRVPRRALHALPPAVARVTRAPFRRRSFWVGSTEPREALETAHQHQVEPLVRPSPLRARRCSDLVRDDRARSLFRLRGHPAESRGRPGCRARDPVDGRRVDGEPGRSRPHDHDGRRPVGDGPVLAANRPAHPPRQAEPARHRALRRHVRALHPRGPRGDESRATARGRSPASPS